MGSYLIRVFGR